MDNNIHLHFCPRVMLILQPFVITLFLLYWTVNKTGLYSEKRYHSYFLMLFTIQTSLEWQFRRKVVGVCSQDVQKHKVEKIVPNSELCRVEGTGLQREHQVINSKTSAELQAVAGNLSYLCSLSSKLFVFFEKFPTEKEAHSNHVALRTNIMKCIWTEEQVDNSGHFDMLSRSLFSEEFVSPTSRNTVGSFKNCFSCRGMILSRMAHIQ